MKKTLISGVCMTVLSASSGVLASAGPLEFDGSVPAAQKAMLQTDLRHLSTMTVWLNSPEKEPQVSRIFESDSLTGKDLAHWIQTRIRLVIGETVVLSKSVYLEKRFHSFENPNLFPVLERSGPPPSRPSEEAPMTVMSNVGAALYLGGKQQGSVLGLQSGNRRVPVYSPRAGIIQIGAGLFHPRASINSQNPRSVANSLGRLSVFAHEARHSDGNGKSLSFVHGVCASGDYQGYAACDRSANGPYTVGALLLKKFAQHCTDCSPAEIEKLKLMSADSFSRIIPPLVASSTLPEEEKIRIQRLMAMVELLISLTTDPKEKAEYVAKLESLRKQLHPVAAPSSSTSQAIPELDARPEGVGLFR